MDDTEIKYFVEAALLAAGQPLSVDQLQNLFDGGSEPEKSQIRQAISSLLEDYEDRGFTIKEVASGYRLQIDSDMVERLQRLWEQRPPRYSRAMFETLALIAYRQPMTRGEIEEIRGVAVSTNIIRSLLEREWVRVVGHRDVPGRPEMFGTTRQFLDYFGLKKLDDLPPLADLSDWESLRVQLNLPAVEEDGDAGELPEDGQPQAVDLAAMDSAAEEGNVDEAIEGQFDPEDSTAEDLPVLNTEEPAIVDVEDVAEIPDIETALSIDAGIEPIKATEWPDPVEGDTVVQTLDTDVADDEAAEHEDADASLTGA